MNAVMARRRKNNHCNAGDTSNRKLRQRAFRLRVRMRVDIYASNPT